MPRMKKQPAYRRHKARNCAVVTINGRSCYLGEYDSPESHEKYARLIAEWRAREGAEPSGTSPATKLTITGLAIAYWEFAQGYYKKGGVPTGQLTVIKPALRTLRRLYGNTLAVDFGPLALQALQEHWINAGLSRTYINGHTIKAALRKRRHRPLGETGRWLGRVVQGWLNYHAVPGNSQCLNRFVDEVTRYWLRQLRRQSTGKSRLDLGAHAPFGTALSPASAHHPSVS